MANLKQLRVRISSVKSTQKITAAMKMVAASKLRRAQEAAEQGRPYAERMSRLIGALGAGMAGREDGPALLVGTGADQTHLIVLATAERGLCGAFNSSLAKAAKARAQALMAAGKTVKILCVGRKGAQALRRELGGHILDTIELAGIRQVGFEHARPIAARLLAMFDAGEFDTCTIFYSRFASVLSQVVTEHSLIPTALPESEQGEQIDLAGAVYDYEPDEEDILRDLLPRNLAVQVFRALLENAASEQGARMSAMDNATRNAGDMIDRLTLTYNRARQAAITTELIEIISGAEAL